MSDGYLQNKFNTFIVLARKGKMREILHAISWHLVRIYKYRIITLNVDRYIPGRYKAQIPLKWKMAEEDDILQLLKVEAKDLEKDKKASIKNLIREKTCFNCIGKNPIPMSGKNDWCCLIDEPPKLRTCKYWQSGII